jgi:hypothetical protein
MAVTALTVDKWTINTLDALPATAAVASDGASSPKYLATIDCSGLKGNALLVILENADAVNTEVAKILKGTGEWAALADVSQTMVAATTYYIYIDISAYIQTSGTYAGKIVIEGASADTKAAAISFPLRG